MIRADLTGTELQRVSIDASGRERSLDEQHDENAAAADAEGITLTGDPYRDVARASRSTKAKRAGFERLLEDLRRDTFAADVLILWESSRGSRRVSEWVDLLELLDDRGKLVYVTTHHRLYDPRNPRDRRSMLEDAVDSEYESAKSAHRIRRTMAASAENGDLPGGRRAFGYTRGGEVLDAEAEVIRDAVRRILAGETVRSVAASLNAAGIRTPGTVANPAGNTWRPGPLQKMLTGYRIAGLRVHRGRVVAQGCWPAIIDADTRRRLVATFASRSTGGRGRAPWLLTGVLKCAKCGCNLYGERDTSTKGGVRRYKCKVTPGNPNCGRNAIRGDDVEDLLGALVTERLADVEARQAATIAEDDTGEHAELNRIAAKRIEVADDYAADRIAGAAYVELLAALDRYQADVDRRLAAKTTASAPLDFVRTEGYAGRRWDDLDDAERGILLGALIESVTVAPATVRGSTRFEPGRLTAPGRIAWRV